EPRAERTEAETRSDERVGLADAQPVLDLLAESMGVSLGPDAGLLAARALQFATKPDGKIPSSNAVEALRRRQDEAAANSMRALTDRLHDTTVDWNVEFLIATVPDYVDSNSGWVADETIGAIQSAMSDADFVLDRFRLIDWSRSVDDRSAKFLNSRLHERQPGALIFRKVNSDRHRARSDDQRLTVKADGKKREVALKVVLLVLETPTSGVHRPALRNAMNLAYSWAKQLPSTSNPSLKVIAPVFSGSV